MINILVFIIRYFIFNNLILKYFRFSLFKSLRIIFARNWINYIKIILTIKIIFCFILTIIIFIKSLLSKLYFIILILLFQSLILNIFKLLLLSNVVLYSFKIIIVFNYIHWLHFFGVVIRKRREINLIISSYYRNILMIKFLLKYTLIVLNLVL